MEFKIKAIVIDKNGLHRTITRLAHEIIERNSGATNLAIIGIRTRGVTIAERLVKQIEIIENKQVPFGILDITLYRDDFRMRLKQPAVRATEISFNIDDMNLILVDDVMYTGRTSRAALDALMDIGRPATIQLAVLVDRGHRELPIQPDYVGKAMPTSIGEEVRVLLSEVDNDECVLLVEASEEV
ncbi:bifunctional pyr operon transcriptional regulator/uracil phosphoribosyltransferase PyrR [candidate division KSB1 bacterium]|nr:bifunctional pyr operon transcriptional regulator/uracil phosphoribosyltransferase PyrR [candidate division KSB1 bacterium]RQW06767.1 MAG: bifunctional pyr operon transcriptional regulator/uracil phosphoribosyltransferase PyrR [candidate division KSB1 bacterium]